MSTCQGDLFKSKDSQAWHDVLEPRWSHFFKRLFQWTSEFPGPMASSRVNLYFQCLFDILNLERRYIRSSPSWLRRSPHIADLSPDSITKSPWNRAALRLWQKVEELEDKAICHYLVFHVQCSQRNLIAQFAIHGHIHCDFYFEFQRPTYIVCFPLQNLLMFLFHASQIGAGGKRAFSEGRATFGDRRVEARFGQGGPLIYCTWICVWLPYTDSDGTWWIYCKRLV